VQSDFGHACTRPTPVGSGLAEPNGAGYGKFSIFHRNFYVHVLSFTMAKGRIPEGYEVDHVCNNSLCVNPEH
jgi:hypothetical protein